MSGDVRVKEAWDTLRKTLRTIRPGGPASASEAGEKVSPTPVQGPSRGILVKPLPSWRGASGRRGGNIDSEMHRSW